MSLLFIDGFEDKLHNLGKWDYSAANWSANGRTGACVYLQIYTYYMSKRLKPAEEHATLITGFAIQFTGGWDTSHQGFYQLLDYRSDLDSTSHTWLGVNGSGLLAVYRANHATSATTGAIQIGKAAAPLMNNRWYYIEFKSTLASSNGPVEVRVDNQTVISVSTSPTRNSLAGTKSVYDSIRFWGDGSYQTTSGDGFIDDLYLCNGAGSTNNDFIGDCVIETTYPNGNGDVSNLLGSDANSVDNYAMVDEPGDPVATDYNQSDVVGARDLYQVGDLTRVGAVKGVQVSNYAKKSDAGVRAAKNIIKTGGTVVAGPTAPLATNSLAVTSLWETNPATSASWTPAEVNGLQVGIEVA